MTTPDLTVSAPRLSGTQRMQLLVLMSASFTLAVDFGVLNVALPVIGCDGGFTIDTVQWLITAFALPAAGFSLFFGRLGDLLGRRELLLAAMELLGVGSLLGGLVEHSANS